ncbi:MAG: carbamoyl transferase, partial [Acidobacteria bacterium]|nr:carbamoyl transferase [Acidobacteriota bacterium]
AGYGDAEKYRAELMEKIHFDGNGCFEVDPEFSQFRVDAYDGFESIFGAKRRPDEEITDRHRDAAAALQQITNEAILAFAYFIHRETGLTKLCYAGGVALNCVTNGILVDQGPFDEVFIQPAANDAGTALGAAFYVWNHMLDGERRFTMKSAYLGPEFHEQEMASAVKEKGTGKVFGKNELASEVAGLIAGGEIVAWFQGRMEFGPRALGNRSILADPRRADVVHLLNDKVKHREYFRPFAASVLAEKAREWFDIGRDCAGDAFMLCARKVNEDQNGRIPAVTHVDETCRIQLVERDTNPEYHALITRFERITGVPMVLNTSFNDREPIICSPEDAVATCKNAGIRYLVMGDRLFDLQLNPVAEPARKSMIGKLRAQLSEYFEMPVLQPFRCR